MDTNFANLASEESVQKTIAALKANGMGAEVVDTSEEAKEKVLSMLPKGVEVFALSSETLKTIGVTQVVDESGEYDSVRKKLMSLDRTTQSRQMQEIGSAPEYAVGSIHAVTEEGHVYIASNTGSQLPADVYGSSHVVWVVGTQKIVKDNDQAIKRIYEYVLPRESDRLNKQYNTNVGSFVSKLLIINREIVPERIHIIFVKEKLGF